jgi:hypothetical protein
VGPVGPIGPAEVAAQFDAGFLVSLINN